MDSRWQLHRARVEKSIDLSRISALTALSPSIVRKIDDGRFEELPGGVYARSYVRAFAEAVGIAPEEAIREVEHLLPEPPDPFPALRDSAGRTRLEALAAAIVGQACELAARLTSVSWAEPSGRLGAVAEALPTSLRRLGAATIDAMILLAVGTVQALLTAWVCGVSIDVLLAAAGGALAATCLVPIGSYFLIFQGIAGQTPGIWAFRIRHRDPPAESRELNLSLIASRLLRRV